MRRKDSNRQSADSTTEPGPGANRIPRRNILASIILIVLTLAALNILFGIVTKPRDATILNITGTPICLPHKDPTIYTLECTIGLKGEDGRFYALENAPTSLLRENFGKQVMVRGILNEASADSPYDVVGNLNVQSAIKQ